MESSVVKTGQDGYVREYMRERRTWGIALTRVINNRYEIVTVRKRYSYSLNLIAQGKFNNDDADTIKLLSGLYNEEKPCIMTLNFAHIWARKYLDSNVNDKYASIKRRFDTTFCADGGVRLRRLMKLAGSVCSIYELPKGGKLHKKELNMMAAIREFTEETGIAKCNYTLFPGESRQYIFISDGIKYINTYYLAFTDHDLDISVDFSRREQFEEIIDCKWLSVEDIRNVDTNKRLENFVQPIFNFVRNYINM